MMEDQEQEQDLNKRIKHVPELSSAEVKGQFLKETIDNNYTVFGGAVRDFIAGVECNDIDIYIHCSRPVKVDFLIRRFIQYMNKYSFRQIELDENVNWADYKDFETNTKFPAIVIHYEVGYKGIFFNVDLVLSRFSPCFGNLDCIVNGLYMSKYKGISFVTNFNHEGLRKMNENDLLILARKMITERKAGMLPGCDQHRIEKMITKGYNVDFI
jgi:hypothetical protein